MTGFASCRNGQRLPLAEVPLWAPEEFTRHVLAALADGRRITALFGMPDGEAVVLVAVLSWDAQGLVELARTRVRERYPALTPAAPQAHWFEREIAEQWGLVPEGHPWLKPIRFQPQRRGPSAAGQPGVTDFFQVAGEEIHEVAVGPVHAGIIEPGHFRFQCHGETVLHLEIALGYQHRGVERALVGGPDRRSLPYMETLAGDTSVGHATAYALILEGLSGRTAPARAQAIRSLSLELERLANHTGDLGAIAGDIGFLPTAAYCGRLRGDLLNASALICGSRFGRGLVRPGGVGFDLGPAEVETLRKLVAATFRDVRGAVGLLWSTSSVMARLEDAGTVTAEDAQALGWVGPTARACGLLRDVRYDHPWDAYHVHLVPPATMPGGDVYARAQVRWLEIERAAEFIGQQLPELPGGPIRAEVALPLPPAHVAVALVEGWRGEICHVAVTDHEGRLAAYKVVDPSFHNWFALALALRNQPISDFPLCNKSFNLSYCGHDL
jgi:Ni,Fe-hydrogenase III large subunit